MIDSKWISLGSLLTPPAHPTVFSVVGAPLHRAAITPGRCDLAPVSIRRVLNRISSFDAATGFDLAAVSIADWNDVAVSDLTPEAADEPIRATIQTICAATSGAVAILGGDNSVTRPAFHGVRRGMSSLGLLTFDAHHDVRETDRGLSNGNPIRALIEDGVDPADIVQIGIQPFANSKAHSDYALARGIRGFDRAAIRREGIDAVVTQAIEMLAMRCDAIYVDLDLDVMDRASVPSTAGSRPGGLSVIEILSALRILGASGKVRAMDIVEHDPERDLNDTTAFTAGVSLATFFAAVADGYGPS